MPQEKKIKLGGKTDTYRISMECTICNAKDENGKSVRLKIDKHLVTNSIIKTIAYIKDLGYSVTDTQVANHIERHSPYIKEMKVLVKEKIENLALDKIRSLEMGDVIVDAEDVIQEVITKGAQKIKTGEMEVSEKLLIAMVKEQGTRKKMGTLHELIETMDRQRFSKEPKIIEGEVASGEETTQDL